VDLRQAITRLSAAGVTLQARGDRLAVESKAPLTDQQREWLKDHKTDLLLALLKPYHLWDIIEPTGTAWRSCFSPPKTQTQVLDDYPLSTTATPAEGSP
jgi:hypothetical protein